MGVCVLVSAPLDLSSYDDIINTYLTQWGLSDLIPTVSQLGLTGAGSDQINLTLQQTPEWQARFAGNTARMAAGLAPLDPATYIGLEDSYAQVTRDLPAGMVTKSLTDQWIGGDVSASEVSDRVNMANEVYLNADDATKQAWDQFSGAPGQANAVAAILDPDTAESVLQTQVAAAQIGGAAINQGLTANKDIATQAAQQGVTLASARTAYQQIASRLPTDTSIANRFGQTFGQTQEEQATLLGQADQGRQQQTMYGEEQSLFAGHSGATDTSGNPGSNY